MFSNKLFNLVDKNNHYVLVKGMYDIDLFVGLSEDGLKTIKLQDSFKPQKITGSSSIEIKQFSNTNKSTLLFALKDDNLSSVFYLFCDDLISSLKDKSSRFDPYQIILNRYNKWKKMFSGSNNHLSEPEIMGLIGEILYLKNILFDKYGISKAINGWSGQELTHKDFSYDNDWFEVKTLNKHSLSVKISSIEQLDSIRDGYLILVFLEKMSLEFNGITLNNIIDDVLNTIKKQEDKDLFLAKISSQGYKFNDYYNNFNYAFCGFEKYIVNNYFPRLRKSDINESIVKAQYDISLLGIKKFLTKD